MTTGFAVTNGSSELTFSSEAWMYQYVGLATYVSTTNPTSTDAGYSTYTATWNAPIIVGLGLSNSGTLYSRRIKSISQAGSTWTIEVEAGNGSNNAFGFRNQEQAVVLVFGQPISLANSYGMAVYDGSGVLKADLSVKPFSVGQVIAFSNSDTTQSIQIARIDGIPKIPYVVGHPLGRRLQIIGNGGSGDYTTKSYQYGWYWTSSPDTLGRTGMLQTIFVETIDANMPSSDTITLSETTVCTTAYNGILVA